MNSIPDRIYEATFNPDLWEEILVDIAKITNARFSTIVMYSPRIEILSNYNKPNLKMTDTSENRRFIESVLSDIRSSNLINSGFFEVDISKGGFQNVSRRSRLAQEFENQGIGPQVGTLTDTGSGSIVSLKFGRWIGEQGFEGSANEVIESVYPAYLQAIRVSSLLQFNRARGATDALAALKLPAAIISATGQMIHHNGLFENVGDYLYKSTTGRLEVRGTERDKKEYAVALEKSSVGSATFSIEGNFQRKPALVYLISVRRSATEIFPSHSKIIILSKIDVTKGHPAAELLQDLFGLTPAEAQISHHLASGLSLAAAAAAEGITTGTARAYLHRIFTKTETHQQSELISLIKSGAF